MDGFCCSKCQWEQRLDALHLRLAGNRTDFMLVAASMADSAS